MKSLFSTTIIVCSFFISCVPLGPLKKDLSESKLTKKIIPSEPSNNDNENDEIVIKNEGDEFSVLNSFNSNKVTLSLSPTISSLNTSYDSENNRVSIKYKVDNFISNGSISIFRRNLKSNSYNFIKNMNSITASTYYDSNISKGSSYRYLILVRFFDASHALRFIYKISDDVEIPVIDSINLAPKIHIQNNIIRQNAGTTFLLDASGTKDPEGDHLTFKWTNFNLKGITIQSPHSPKTLVSTSVASFGAVVLEVSDSAGNVVKGYVIAFLKDPTNLETKFLSFDVTKNNLNQALLNWKIQTNEELKENLIIFRKDSTEPFYRIIKSVNYNSNKYTDLSVEPRKSYQYILRVLRKNNTFVESKIKTIDIPGDPTLERYFLAYFIDSSTNTRIKPIINEGSYSSLPETINIEVVPKNPSATILNIQGSVNFIRTEQSAPYALWGDNNGDFSKGFLPDGNYQLKMISNNVSETLSFSISGSSTSIPVPHPEPPPPGPKPEIEIAQATLNADNTIKLNWLTKNIDPPYEVRIFRSMNKGNFLPWKTETSSTATDQETFPGNTYQYSIRIFKSNQLLISKSTNSISIPYENPNPNPSGSVYYLDAIRGNDNSTCTKSNPCKTLSHFNNTIRNQLKLGDAVRLLPGTYSGAGNNSCIIASNGVTYEGRTNNDDELNNDSSVIIDMNGCSDEYPCRCNGVQANGETSLTKVPSNISNFTVRDMNIKNMNASHNQAGSGVSLGCKEHCQGVTIDRVKFENMGANGLVAGFGAQGSYSTNIDCNGVRHIKNLQIIDSKFIGFKKQGLTLGCVQGFKILRSEISAGADYAYANDVDCLQITGGIGHNSNTPSEINYNKVYNCPQNALGIGGHFRRSGNIVVEGNTFGASGDEWAKISGGNFNRPIWIRNNHFKDKGAGFEFAAQGENIHLENNRLDFINAGHMMKLYAYCPNCSVVGNEFNALASGANGNALILVNTANTVFDRGADFDWRNNKIAAHPNRQLFFTGVLGINGCSNSYNMNCDNLCTNDPQDGCPNPWSNPQPQSSLTVNQLELFRASGDQGQWFGSESGDTDVWGTDTSIFEP